MLKLLSLTFALFFWKVIIVHGTNTGEPQICYPLRNHNNSNQTIDYLKGEKGDKGDSGMCDCSAFDSKFERLQTKLRYFSGRPHV